MPWAAHNVLCALRYSHQASNEFHCVLAYAAGCKEKRGSWFWCLLGWRSHWFPCQCLDPVSSSTPQVHRTTASVWSHFSFQCYCINHKTLGNMKMSLKYINVSNSNRECEIFFISMAHNELKIPSTGRWKINEQCVHIFRVVLKSLQHKKELPRNELLFFLFCR